MRGTYSQAGYGLRWSLRKVKGKIVEVKVTSRASNVTIERALEILQAAKEIDPNAAVDMIIYHVVQEREIDEEVEE